MIIKENIVAGSPTSTIQSSENPHDEGESAAIACTLKFKPTKRSAGDTGVAPDAVNRPAV